MHTINQEDALFLIIDIQEKLAVMLKNQDIENNAIKLAKTAGILNIPTIITEQYPKGLGTTLNEIKLAVPNAKYIEKTSFNVFHEAGLYDFLKSYNKKQIVLFGIETHICVLQTAMELKDKGYEVYVVENASGSRTQENKVAALKRLIHAGIQIVTVEMVLFELLKSSKHPKFKEIQALIK